MAQWLAALAAMLLPFVIIHSFPKFFHSSDVDDFFRWSQAWAMGWRNVYINCDRCNYPLLGTFLSGGVMSSIHIADFSHLETRFRYYLAIVDALNILAIWFILIKLEVNNAPLWAGVIGLLPSSWLGASVWGQIDGMGLLLFFIALIWFNSKERPTAQLIIFSALAGFILSLMLLTKQLIYFSMFALGAALLVNFTNPAGLVTQALSKYAADVPGVGVCNVPITAKMHILEGLEKSTGQEIDPSRAGLDTLGLNHLSWHRGFTVDGEDVWPQVLQQFLAELRSDPEPEWDPRTIESLRMIPNYYLQYFYHTDRKLAAQAQWPPSRAEEVMAVEKDLLRQYADPALQAPPADLMKRGGAYYSTVATQLLSAHFNDLGEAHVVNVANGGAVRGWPSRRWAH